MSLWLLKIQNVCCIYFQNHSKKGTLEIFQNILIGWCLLNLVSLQLNIVRYNPLKASSFIELPESIKNKQACLNVQNTGDDKCFLWAILSAEKNIHRRDQPHRVSHYTEFEDTLNMDGIPTPVPITSIPRFERLNNRSVNVYVLRWNRSLKKHDVDPVYISDVKQPQHVNLLYISNEKGQSHYVWIKDMSRLLHGQTTQNRVKHFICDRCLHGCISQRSLDKHTEKCQEYRAQRTVFAQFAILPRKLHFLRFLRY